MAGGSSAHEPVTRGSSRGLPVPAPPASKREVLQARRKLLFKGNLFEGERFYLDLDGYNNTKQLEADLYEMGAFVERFFNKQVTKIITNKKESNHNRNNSSSSSLSRLSSTRAAALLSKSIASSKNCDNTSIQEKAKKMGIKTVQLKVVLDIVSREKEKSAKPLDLLNEVKSCPMSAPRARKLKTPYIKVEDASCKYRPVCSNFTKLPLIDLSNVKQSVKVEKLPVPKLDFSKENHDANNPQSVPLDAKPKDLSRNKNDPKAKSAKRAPAAKPKNGYCEICDAVYTDLKEHTKSDSHGQIVCNKEYWSTLDEVINALPCLSSLIDNIVKKQEVNHRSISILPVEEAGSSVVSIRSSNDANNCDNIGNMRNSSITVCDPPVKTDLVSKDQTVIDSDCVRRLLSSAAQSSKSVIVLSGCGDEKNVGAGHSYLEEGEQVPDANSLIAAERSNCDEVNNNNEGSKCSKLGKGDTSQERKSACCSSFSINSLAFATEAVFGDNVYGSDRSVAREIEEGLDALLDCVSNITFQLQSQPSAIAPSDKERDAFVTKEEGAKQNSEPNLGICEKRADLTNGNSSQRKRDEEMEEEQKSQNAANIYDENLCGESEISNENYIFSSLSLVENDFVDNMALNDFNHEGLSVLSEITEKYVLSVPCLGNMTGTSTKDDMSHSVNQLYNFNTESILNQTIIPSQYNEISTTTIIPAKTVLPMDEDCVQSVLDKEDLKENDFSDLSEVSVVNAGLPGDTFVNIMQTLDKSDEPPMTDASLECKDAGSSVSPTKPAALQNLLTECDRKDCSIIQSSSSSQSKSETISRKLDDILKTVIERKANKQSNRPVVNLGRQSVNVPSEPEKRQMKSCTYTGDELSTVKEDCNKSDFSEKSDRNLHESIKSDDLSIMTAAEVVGYVGEVTKSTEDSASTSSFVDVTSDTLNDVSGDEKSTLASIVNSDADATLCYGESSSGSDSDLQTTPTKEKQNESSSEIGTSERESQAFLTRSSSLPHNEDACDGMSDCPTEYDVQSTGGSFNSTMGKQEVDAGTEQSLSLGYHSYSPFEDSLGIDIVPLKPPSDRNGIKVCPAQTFSNVPKPACHEPIKIRINVKKKQCTIVKETEHSLVDRSSVLNKSDQPLCANMTPRNHSGSTSPWTGTSPTGVELRVKNLRETPNSNLKSPLRRVIETPNSVNSLQHKGSWSVQKSGGLKLKFSSSSKSRTVAEKSMDTNPSTPKHKLEHSPQIDDGEKPSKRRRKLFYPTGTVRW